MDKNHCEHENFYILGRLTCYDPMTYILINLFFLIHLRKLPEIMPIINQFSHFKQMKSIRNIIEQQQRRKAPKRTRKSSEFDDSSVFQTQSEGNDDEEPASDEGDAENRPPVEFQCGKTERGAFCIWVPIHSQKGKLVPLLQQGLRCNGSCKRRWRRRRHHWNDREKRAQSSAKSSVLPRRAKRNARSAMEKTNNAMEASHFQFSRGLVHHPSLSDFLAAILDDVDKQVDIARSARVFPHKRRIKYILKEQLIGDALDEAEYNTDEDVMNILSLLSLQMQGYVGGLRARGAQREHEDRE